MRGPELWEEAKKIIPGGNQLLSKRSEMFLPNLWPSYYAEAKGVEILDLDGNRFVDMSIMGIGSCILGYADKDVDSAVVKAITNGSMSTLNSPEEIELANILCEIHPWAKMVRYARSGGEAMAIAVRIARAHSGKDKIAFCGYHGWHDWYLAANLADDKNLDGHLLPGLKPAGVPRGLKGTAIPFHYNDLDELKKIVSENKDIGVIITEAIRLQEPKNNFLHEVKKIAKKIGAVLIFDEISSGWRSVAGGAHLLYKVNPDIAVFAKAMSNGYPMSAIIGRKNVMQSAQKTFISSTYWTERIGPTAALATIHKIVSHNVPAHLERIGRILIKALRKLAEKHDIKITIPEHYPVISFTFDYGEKSMAVKTLFTQEMLRRGFLASNVIYITYAHKEFHIERYLKNVDVVFKIIKKAISENNIEKLLEGLISHSGFKRLT
ncbi:MAG: aminotransferase class III-fold pyridoxal phosphate-dependent enzyme [Patescibacteria group bacterium]